MAAASGRKERKRKACLSLPTHNGIGLGSITSQRKAYEAREKKERMLAGSRASVTILGQNRLSEKGGTNEVLRTRKVSQGYIHAAQRRCLRSRQKVHVFQGTPRCARSRGVWPVSEAPPLLTDLTASPRLPRTIRSPHP